MRLITFAIILSFAADSALAVAPNECEQQRAAYPKAWNNISKETELFNCSSHYSGQFRITLGEIDVGGRSLMSLVPLKGRDDKAKQDPFRDVYRIWLDAEQTRRLKEKKYFATVVRRQTSCWVRGALQTSDSKTDSVFFMDNADIVRDELRPEAGSFYNKAPRFSVFQGDAYSCEPIK
jgi:hypothetical protein